MTDITNKPIDNSKEELSEAELDQVAGGSPEHRVGATEVGKTPTLPRGIVAGIGPDAVKRGPALGAVD